MAEGQVKTPEERGRLIKLAISLLEENCHDYVVGLSTAEGSWYMESSSKCFGIGAAERIGMEITVRMQKDLENE